LGWLAEHGIGNPDAATTSRDNGSFRPRHCNEKILPTLPTAGEPGWDRTNDLLIKSLFPTVCLSLCTDTASPAVGLKSPGKRVKLIDTL